MDHIGIVALILGTPITALLVCLSLELCIVSQRADLVHCEVPFSNCCSALQSCCQAQLCCDAGKRAWIHSHRFEVFLCWHAAGRLSATSSKSLWLCCWHWRHDFPALQQNHEHQLDCAASSVPDRRHFISQVSSVNSHALLSVAAASSMHAWKQLQHNREWPVYVLLRPAAIICVLQEPWPSPLAWAM